MDSSGPRSSKYRNQRTTVDNITFASKREAKRFAELKLLEKAHRITALTLQPAFPLMVKGQKICTYIGDFQYLEWQPNDRVIRANVVEDAKGHRTKDYIIKAKLFRALHPEIEHREV